MRLWKLTDQDGYTQRNKTGETLWEAGKTLKLKSCEDPKLCTSQVIHAYTNSSLALLLNPCHANLLNPLLWEAKGTIKVQDWGKVGCFSLTTVKQLPMPDWYVDMNTKKRVAVQFAILCAEAVLNIFEKQQPKDDRPRKAIEAAKEYLRNPKTAAAAYAAARAAALAAADAADAAARAADAAADAAYAAARAAYAAAAAARAADAADAYAAARAAADAAYASRVDAINFASIADKAVRLCKI